MAWLLSFLFTLHLCYWLLSWFYPIIQGVPDHPLYCIWRSFRYSQIIYGGTLYVLCLLFSRAFTYFESSLPQNGKFPKIGPNIVKIFNEFRSEWPFSRQTSGLEHPVWKNIMFILLDLQQSILYAYITSNVWWDFPTNIGWYVPWYLY